MAPQNIPRAISVLTLANKVILYCIVEDVRRAEDRKGAETNSGTSGARNLEAENIRRRAASTGGCVKLKTVTEVRRVLFTSCIRKAMYIRSVSLSCNKAVYTRFVSLSCNKAVYTRSVSLSCNKAILLQQSHVHSLCVFVLESSYVYSFCVFVLQ